MIFWENSSILAGMLEINDTFLNTNHVKKPTRHMMTNVYRGKSANTAAMVTNPTVNSGLKLFALVLCGLLGWMTFTFATQLMLRTQQSGIKENMAWSVLHRLPSVSVSDSFRQQKVSWKSDSNPQAASPTTLQDFSSQTASRRFESRVR